ncbi:site-specific integrase [Polaromonas sp. CG_23.6]|uniref:tyrosine-type recombinase/integrase n=1 Tax=Polaromonas sp. CG_23.6 TaxID=2760709 RepID=UPI0024744615|nr:site-specific integrase [Polaromonas sp. CG_23.6]MDH6186781.1 integrase [Polaromonas sp. CG_23.6]
MHPAPALFVDAAAPEDLGGMAFFEGWQSSRLLDSHRKPMGAAGLGQAGFVWRKWLAFCTGRDVSWQAASPGDVQSFAGDISPRKPGARAVSPVTLRRYWRILNDLYAHAVLSGTLAHNPASEVMPATSEKTASLALPPHLWALLQEGLPCGYQFRARRNRLVLLLMMRCALTVREVISLTLGSVQVHEGTPGEIAQRLALEGLPLLQPESAFWTPLASSSPPPVYSLQLAGARPVQTRQLMLDNRTSAALHDWLEVRKLGKAGAGDRLIVGSAEGAAITPKSLYNLCQAHMARCLVGFDIGQMGPNTLRNTCISCWLNQGVPLNEILRRCGLKDDQVLIRLQKHLNPAVIL